MENHLLECRKSAVVVKGLQLELREFMQEVILCLNLWAEPIMATFTDVIVYNLLC